MKEVLRWHPVLPLGIPHCTVDDDELDGYFVPAGTVVFCNVWCVRPMCRSVCSYSSCGLISDRCARRACMRDPEVYEEPEQFRPERFIRGGKIDPSVRDPAAFVFGFGRRCVAPSPSWYTQEALMPC